jgi:hypothetical protein
MISGPAFAGLADRTLVIVIVLSAEAITLVRVPLSGAGGRTRDTPKNQTIRP